MILETASEKKSVRVRLILDKPDEADHLLKAAREAFKCVTVIDEDSDKNNVPAHVSYGDDDKTLVIQLPKWATLRVKDADTIKRTDWSVNRVQIKTKAGTAIFQFKKSIS